MRKQKKENRKRKDKTEKEIRLALEFVRYRSSRNNADKLKFTSQLVSTLIGLARNMSQFTKANSPPLYVNTIPWTTGIKHKRIDVPVMIRGKDNVFANFSIYLNCLFFGSKYYGDRGLPLTVKALVKWLHLD
ncbi:MAG: hypothetical protein EOP48_09800 [Sphingobacteriales bacterium]|nr:MAG: hypothetical protein EOP48_09800 [Sphingobacteriales bacterium]